MSCSCPTLTIFSKISGTNVKGQAKYFWCMPGGWVLRTCYIPSNSMIGSPALSNTTQMPHGCGKIYIQMPRGQENLRANTWGCPMVRVGIESDTICITKSNFQQPWLTWDTIYADFYWYCTQKHHIRYINEFVLDKSMTLFSCLSSSPCVMISADGFWEMAKCFGLFMICL